MTLRVLISVAALVACTQVQAFDAALTTGVAVTTERISGTAVDGVQLTIERATGSGVAELARRIESLWASQGSEVLSLQQGKWTLRTRLRGTLSDVLQWRGEAQQSELLLSSLHVAAAVTVPETGIVLPAGCQWGRSVHGTAAGRAYVQRSALCAMATHALMSTLPAALQRDGWRARHKHATGLMLERNGEEGLLQVVSRGSADSWLIWLRVGTPRRQ